MAMINVAVFMHWGNQVDHVMPKKAETAKGNKCLFVNFN